jgi:two-component system sensor histidine kinase YesM
LNYIMMRDRVVTINVYNLNGGHDLYISPNKPIDYNYNPKDEAWFRDFLQSEDITRDLPPRLDLQTKNKDNWAIFNVRKIFDMNNGKLLGVMLVTVDIEFINKLNKRMQESVRSAFTIVDNENRVVYNNDYTTIGQPFSSLFPIRESLLSSDSDKQVVRVNGKSYILIRAEFELHDWKTYVYMPVDELAVESNILKRNLLAIVLMLIIFAFVSAYYMSALITRPIKQLMNNMTLIEQGKFDNLPIVRSNDEIGLMAIRFTKMSNELKRLVERIYEEQEQKIEAELRALQAQINPHFLYNTLNSLKWIASIQRSNKIVEMTESLISLLRYTARNERTISVRDELDHIQDYIVIQKVRYFNRIEFSCEIENDLLLDVAIPKLSIQPLVENAIFHGIADKEDGKVWIQVKYGVQSSLEINVRDNGSGIDEETANQLKRRLQGEEIEGSIGIINVHSRLLRMFGEPYGISFVSSHEQGTEFKIRIPVQYKEASEI